LSASLKVQRDPARRTADPDTVDRSQLKPFSSQFPRKDSMSGLNSSKGGPPFMQLVRSGIDASVAGLSFDARAIFTDLLMRVDYRTRRYVTTLTDYSSFLGIPRRRLSLAVNELVSHTLLIGGFVRGHDGAVEIAEDIYASCVRSRGARAPLAHDSRDARAELRERPAQSRQISDIEESQKSDPIFRFQAIRDRWANATGRTTTDDDLARCLTRCRTACVDLRADFYRIIDETLGKVAEEVDNRPNNINDLCGYMVRAVERNAREALGMSA
jgi:hypothetical protein